MSVFRFYTPNVLETSHQGFLGTKSPEIAALNPVVSAYSNCVNAKYSLTN